MAEMEEGIHRRINSNGIWLHVVEKGKGPLVLLLHGFPELWFSWRHQISFLAGAGYCAVAPDMRGYGDSDSPLDVNSYSLFHLAGDLISILDYYGQHQVFSSSSSSSSSFSSYFLLQAFVVGHDVGAVVATSLSLFRPDCVKAMVILGTVPPPLIPNSCLIESISRCYSDGHFICQFQEAGRAEMAFARYDYMTVIKKFMLMTRGSMVAPPGMEIVDSLETPAVIPPWISEEELRVYADKFEESGFTGAFNFFRALDRSSEMLGPWKGSKIRVPTKVVVGGKDWRFEYGGVKEYIEGGGLEDFIPAVHHIVLDQAHHSLQQELPDDVSREILSFLNLVRDNQK